MSQNLCISNHKYVVFVDVDLECVPLDTFIVTDHERRFGAFLRKPIKSKQTKPFMAPASELVAINFAINPPLRTEVSHDHLPAEISLVTISLVTVLFYLL